MDNTSEIINFVKSNSYLVKQSLDKNDMSFTTRRNCWGGNYSQSDVDECNRVIKLLNQNFENLDYDITTCDEWVNLYIYKH